MAISNPWITLSPSGPYILEVDKNAVINHQPVENECRFHPELMPEPFIGNPNASIVFLNANPGYCKQDLAWHQKLEFQKASRANLHHIGLDYPFFLLHPDFREAPGGKYWRKRFRELAKKMRGDSESGYRHVASRILLVESCPYHSARFKPTTESIPSQKYSDSLIYKAIHRDALIVMIRRAKEWETRITGLSTYQYKIRVKSAQCGYVSSGNMKYEDWSMLIKHLQ